jgi:hypothetical protein
LKVTREDISFELLQPKDIELVRIWRNEEYVRKRLIYSHVISESQQKKWYKNLDKLHDLYFIVKQKEVKVGVSSFVKINWEEGHAETAYFQYTNPETKSFNDVYVKTSLLMGDFFLNFYNFSFVTAKIKTDNTSVINFLKLIGYEVIEATEDLLILKCTLQAFNKNRNKITSILNVLHNKSYDYTININLYEVPGYEALHQINLIKSENLDSNHSNMIFIT